MSFFGTVEDVRGDTLSVTLDKSTVSGLAFVEGHGYRIGQIGSFVRIPLGYVDLFGLVSQIGAGAVPERLKESEPHGSRWMSIQLLGEGARGAAFSRGVSQYPTVGDPVHLVTQEDLWRIYGQSELPQFLRIGSLASASSIPALIDVNKLITRHSAVLGATGAGKSTTVASILAAVSGATQFPSARVIIIDIHGEYSAALRDRSSVFRVLPRKELGEQALYLPYWALTFDELLSVTFGTVDDPSRAAILDRLAGMKAASLERAPRPGVGLERLNVDTPVPFSIHQLWFDLHRLVVSTHSVAGSGQSESTVALQCDAVGRPIEPGDALRVTPPKCLPATQAPGATKIYLSGLPFNIRRQLEALASRLRDPRYDFLFRPGPFMPTLVGETEQDLDQLLKSWLGGAKPICILDLSGTPQSVLSDLVAIVLRIVYDALFWARWLSEGAVERPVLFVLEEAHTYLGKQTETSAGATVKRIVKEGRKYGIGTMLVSQRPSEIDPTILSQCGTMIAMRLANASDRAQVGQVVTDHLEGLLSMLPTLRTGEAIVVGEAVQLPIRALIDSPPLDRRPDSRDPLVVDAEGPGGWDKPRRTEDYAEVVHVWRSNDPRSPRIIKGGKDEV